MQKFRLISVAALLASAVALPALEANAQQGQDWFVPNQQRGGQPPRAGGPGSGPVRSPAVRVPAGQGPASLPPGPQEPEAPPPQIQVQLPPAPTLPSLPKGASPPAAVIGVLGLADISRGSSAAQQVEKALNERMTKLHDDAQKEQTSWRDVQQQLATQRNSLAPEQIRAKERELQERVTNAQRQFRERNRIVQEAAQYARAQIERTLQNIVVQVADSRGMNLVLHREEVVLNTSSFDITDDVVKQLNAVLPSVVIPPDGMSVSQMPGAVPVAQAQPNGTPAPAGPSKAAAAALQASGAAASASASASSPPAAPAPAAPAAAAPAASQPKRP